MGGHILLGIEEDLNATDINLRFKITGVENVNKIQKDFWNTVNSDKVSSNILHDEDVTVVEIDGKSVVCIHIPRADFTLRPVYINGNLWNNDDDKKFLTELGGYVVDRKNGKDGLTLAGLMMFGKGLSIRERLDNFRMDYVDMSHLVGDECYHDRLTYDGRWENNFYQFFHRVLPKLTFDLPRPFKIEGVRRIDDTPQHKAVREAFTNSIIHSDVFLQGGVLRIDKYDDRLCLRNPGILKLPIEQIYEGGTSKARNPKMQNMLRMIGYGENLGSGFPKIIAAWKQVGWKEPLLENRLDLDEVRLTLYVPFETSDEGGQIVDQKMDQRMNQRMNQMVDEIFTQIKANPNITREELISATGKSDSSIKRYIKLLKQANRIKRIGADYGGHWEVIEKKD